MTMDQLTSLGYNARDALTKVKLMSTLISFSFECFQQVINCRLENVNYVDANESLNSFSSFLSLLTRLKF